MVVFYLMVMVLGGLFLAGTAAWTCYKIATWKPRARPQEPEVQQPVALMRRWTPDRKLLEDQLQAEWADKFARAQVRR